MPLFARHDATLVRDVSRTRAIMPYLMRTRTESAVYFEHTLDVTRACAFIDRRAESGEKLTFFQLYSYAMVRALAEWPRLNRFTSGGRLYQRNAIVLGFSAKKALDHRSPIAVVKRSFEPDATFAEHVDALRGAVAEGRSRERGSTDRELDALLRLPPFALRSLVSLGRWLDAHNLAPRALIDPDPLFCSVFIANLGSVGIDAAFHHLYEWGNCPIFAALGIIRDERGEDGTARRRCTVKYTFDERVEDGLYCAHALASLKARVEQWDEATLR
jgi:hypothetical protein